MKRIIGLVAALIVASAMFAGVAFSCSGADVSGCYQVSSPRP